MGTTSVSERPVFRLMYDWESVVWLFRMAGMDASILLNQALILGAQPLQWAKRIERDFGILHDF